MRAGRGVGRSIVVATLLAAGCTLAPRKFHDLADPSPLVRARAVSLGDGMPDATVVPALLDRLGDPDPVVRLTAHEELKRRTGQDFGYRPWDDAEARAAAAQAWRAWWDGLRAAPGRPYGP